MSTITTNDGTVSAAEQSSQNLEKQSEALRADYQRALEGLQEAVENQAKASPPAK